jgi:hypothetical protein
MRRRRQRWRAAAGLALALVLALLGAVAAPDARAQAPAQPSAQPAAPSTAPEAAQPQAAPESTESSQYRSSIDAALDEFSHGNWTEAHALFAQAHALDPSARTLRGLAACAFEARQYLRAIEYMTAALADPRKPLSETQRREATSLIERAQVFVARVVLAVEPAAARVEVDAVVAIRDDQGRVLLDPGMHQITVSHPGHLTDTRSVSVNPGDALQLSVQLIAVRADPGTGPEVGSGPPGATDSPRSDSQPSVPPRTWAWLTAGLGVALTGTGVALFALGQSGVTDVERACPKDACSPEEIERRIDREHLQELQTGSILAFALAGASAIVSTVLFATGADSDEATLSSTGRGATLRARF